MRRPPPGPPRCLPDRAAARPRTPRSRSAMAHTPRPRREHGLCIQRETRQACRDRSRGGGFTAEVEPRAVEPDARAQLPWLPAPDAPQVAHEIQSERLDAAIVRLDVEALSGAA